LDAAPRGLRDKTRQPPADVSQVYEIRLETASDANGDHAPDRITGITLANKLSNLPRSFFMLSQKQLWSTGAHKSPSPIEATLPDFVAEDRLKYS
jgi:hypothetical protein